MAIKVNTTVVIDNDRSMLNIADTVGEVSILDSKVGLSTCTNNINFTTPFMNCIMAADTTFTESGAAEGRSAQLLLDTTTSAYDPTFSSNINWQGGTEPTWSGYQRWHIIFTALSATDIRAVAFGYDAQGGGTPSNWPGGSATARVDNGSDLSAISDDRETGDPGTGATAISGHRVRFYRRSGGGSRIFWTPVGNGDTGSGDKNAWYNTSGTASAHISAGTTVDFWTENTVDPDATRLVITTTSGTVVTDTGYVTSTSTTTGADLTFSDSTTTTNAGTYNGSETRLMECWARKSGYADTKVATWRFRADTTAVEASCFLGGVMLYMMEDGVITQVAMEDAWQAWELRQNGTEHYCVDQNGDSCQILNFRRIETTDNIYSINGSDPFVTGGHPFLTTDGWKCADLSRGTDTYPGLELTQLAVGDVLLKHNGEQETITDITGSSSTETVYIVDVDGDDTYIANGYIVHNK